MYSIRRRLMLILVGGFSALILGTGVYVTRLLEGHLIEQFDSALRTKAQMLAALTDENEEGGIEFDYAPGDMDEFAREKDPEYFQIWLFDGTVLLQSDRLDEDLPFTLVSGGQSSVPARGGLFTEPRDLQLPDGRAGRMVQVTYRAKGGWDEIDGQNGHEVVDPSLEAPPVAVAVARERESLDQLIARVHLASLLVGSAVILFSVILVWRAVAFGLQPIDAIASQVRKLDADSLGTRLGLPRTPRELAPIVSQVNALLGRLDASFQRERRFAGNVAHELRTPIAELRSLATVGGRSPEDKASVERFFTDVKVIAGHMEGVIVDLLLLARCQAGIEQVVSCHTSLRDLVVSAWSKLAPAARASGVHFELDLTEDLVVESDRGKLAIVLANLLGNAVEYALPNSKICVSGGRTGSRFHLEITNAANPIPVRDLGHLTEPFWRGDGAGASEVHAGLGLSLVSALATLLGLTVRFGQDPDGTFRARATGRLADQATPEKLRHPGSQALRKVSGNN